MQAQGRLMAGTAFGAAQQPQTAKPSCESCLLPEQLHLFRGQAGGKRSISRMRPSLHCNIFTLANLCCVDSACVTDKQDDMGIFPSALLVLLPICTTGLVLTVKYHTHS